MFQEPAAIARGRIPLKPGPTEEGVDVQESRHPFVVGGRADGDGSTTKVVASGLDAADGVRGIVDARIEVEVQSESTGAAAEVVRRLWSRECVTGFKVTCGGATAKVCETLYAHGQFFPAACPPADATTFSARDWLQGLTTTGLSVTISSDTVLGEDVQLVLVLTTKPAVVSLQTTLAPCAIVRTMTCDAIDGHVTLPWDACLAALLIDADAPVSGLTLTIETKGFSPVVLEARKWGMLPLDGTKCRQIVWLDMVDGRDEGPLQLRAGFKYEDVQSRSEDILLQRMAIRATRASLVFRTAEPPAAPAAISRVTVSGLILDTVCTRGTAQWLASGS